MFGGGIFGKPKNRIKLYGYGGKFEGIKIPLHVNIDGENFIKSKTLGKGAYGVVIEYKNKTGKSLVAKIGDVESDLKVIKKLEQSGKKCNQSIVPYETVGKNTLFIMEKLDGDLMDLRGTSNIESIINQIARTLKCLADLGIYYTDIKSANLLYKKRENNEPFVVLGDLGGAGTIDEGHYVSSYPPFDRRKGEGYLKKPTKKDLSWMIGVVFFELVGYDMRSFVYDRIVDMSKPNLNKIVNDLAKQNKKYDRLIRGTLDPNPKSRMTLEEIISITNSNKKVFIEKEPTLYELLYKNTKTPKTPKIPKKKTKNQRKKTRNQRKKTRNQRNKTRNQKWGKRKTRK